MVAMHGNPYQSPMSAYGGPPTFRAPEPMPGVSAFRAIGFAFGEVGFLNLLLGLLMLLVPVVGPIVLLGWQADVHRRLARREAPAVLPFDFNRFIDLLTGGLIPFVTNFVASLVLTVPITLGFFVSIVPLMAAGNSEEPPALAGLLSMIGFVVVFALTLFLTAYIMTPMMIRAELTGRFGPTFDVGAVMSLGSATWPTTLGHTLVLGLMAVPLIFMGMIVFFIGAYVVAVAMQFAAMHLRWQIYEDYLHKGGQPIPILPPGAPHF